MEMRLRIIIVLALCLSFLLPFLPIAPAPEPEYDFRFTFRPPFEYEAGNRAQVLGGANVLAQADGHRAYLYAEAFGTNHFQVGVVTMTFTVDYHSGAPYARHVAVLELPYRAEIRELKGGVTVRGQIAAADPVERPEPFVPMLLMSLELNERSWTNNADRQISELIEE